MSSNLVYLYFGCAEVEKLLAANPLDSADPSTTVLMDLAAAAGLKPAAVTSGPSLLTEIKANWRRQKAVITDSGDGSRRAGANG